jgi:CRISPR-associated protein Csm1
MINKVDSLFFSSLLHNIDLILPQFNDSDIKVLCKTENGRMFINNLKYKSIDRINSSNVTSDDFIYIILFAESLINRVSIREVGQVNLNISNLDDIFNKFGRQKSNRSFEIQAFNTCNRNIFAQDDTKFDETELLKIQNQLLNELKKNSFDTSSKQCLLNLLEEMTSYISCGVKNQQDISFYDHARLVTCIAISTYIYLKTKKVNDYRFIFLSNDSKIYNENLFQLVSFDISGIQSFIYKITSKGAHKQLRSRSFYLDMISEWIVDSLLDRCGLDRTNLLYSGGGHAYFLLPNTDICLQKINQIENSFNHFFLQNFSTDLYVAFGNTEFSPEDLFESNAIQSIYRQVNEKISFKKLHRYSAETILFLNKGGKKKGRECTICHTVNNLIVGENKCRLCDSLENFSRNIQKDTYFEVSDDLNGLLLDSNHSLKKVSPEQVENEHLNKIYAKNLFSNHSFKGIKIWSGDYTDLDNNLFTKYAQRLWKISDHKGIKKIAALRCDVDDLGYAFMAGFSELDEGKNNTFSRTATFSRSMSMFFKAYINEFAQNMHLTIVYAGGDDVFVLGAWDEIIDFAVLLRQNFKKWTDGKLTLSAGIGLFDDKTPINVMARVTGDLEDDAKSAGKDRICLFEKRKIFQFDEFIEEVCQDKLRVIRRLFNAEGEKGNSFIYKLLDLIRQRGNKDRIAFARIAYYLTQLEETVRNKQYFEQFKHSMKDWFDSDRDIKQVEMALILYVYETREEVLK